MGKHNIARECGYLLRSLGKITLGGNISIETTPSDDNRSYHVSSKKIADELGFRAKHTIQKAVSDLKTAFEAGLIPNPMNDIRYYNIKTMQSVRLR